MDYGHKYADDELKALEKRISKEYAQAEKEVAEKLDSYLSKFAVKDKIKSNQVKKGELTETEYTKWRVGQIAIGKRWEEMRQTLAEDFHNTNNIAKEMVKEHSYEIYALNHNYGTYEVENGLGVDTSYTLYDRATVERLVRDDPDMLPPPGKKVAERIKAGLDVRWNNQQIQSVMMQGILQGMSIPELAKRLAETVGDRNMTSAIRNARTMTTGAQNAGRVDSYKRAKDMGIEMKQMWIATLDGRTRDSHRHLDGEMVEVGETFSNGCRFPGDPQGRPEEIYNCRCTLIAKFKDVQYTFAERGTDKASYEEWEQGKEKENNNTFASNIEYSDTLMQSKYDEQRKIINNLVNEYDTRLKSVSTGAEKSAGDVDITGETMRINTTNPNTAIHEFTHTLANTDADKYGLTDDKEFWKEIKSVRRKYMKDVQYDTSRWISSYEHSSNKADEFLAEAFTQAKMTEMGLPLPNKYGNDLTYSQQVLEIVDKYFKRKKH